MAQGTNQLAQTNYVMSVAGHKMAFSSRNERLACPEPLPFGTKAIATFSSTSAISCGAAWAWCYLLFPCHRILLIRNVFWRMVQLVNSVLPCKCWQHMMECRSRDLSVAMASVTAFLCFRSGMVMSTVKRCVNTIESIIDRRPTVSNNARALACLRHQKRPQDNHRHIQWSKRIT